MIFKMLTRVQNIFLVTKNLEETSRKFSIFFGRKYNFIGQSKNLGIDIISFGLHKTNICLISPKHSGIWFEPLNNFLKRKCFAPFQWSLKLIVQRISSRACYRIPRSTN